jgi:putative acetyltransferase
MRALINGLVKENAMVLADRPFKRKEESEWLRNVLKGMKSGRTIHLVAEADGRIVGSTGVERLPGKSRHAGMFGISVKDGYRDIGLGTALAGEAIKQAKRLGLKLVLLEVFDCNPRAIHTYKKIGFREIGRIRNKLYHAKRYHASILMVKEISRMN